MVASVVTLVLRNDEIQLQIIHKCLKTVKSREIATSRAIEYGGRRLHTLLYLTGGHLVDFT